MFGWFARRAGSLGLVVVVMSALMGPVLSASADPTPDTTAATDTPTALTLSVAADSNTVVAGATDGYTVTVSNPVSSSQTVNLVVATLPIGFSYVASSTSGAITDEPTIDASSTVLTWNTSLVVPAADDSGPGVGMFHFQTQVDVATAPDNYLISVVTAGAGLTILDSPGAVPITVSAPTPPPTEAPTTSDTPTPTPSDPPESSTPANPPPSNPPPSNPPATTASSAPSTSAEPAHPSTSPSSTTHPATPHPSPTSSSPVEKAPAASEIDAHGIREVEISLASTSSLSAHRLSTTGAQVRTAFYVSLAAILAGSVLLLVGFVRRGGSRSR